MNPVVIRVIETSSKYDEAILDKNLAYLRSQGMKVLWDPQPIDYENGLTAFESVSRKAHIFKQAFLEPESNVILIARGGYGASEILNFLSSDELKLCKNKPLVGFSDVSSLQSALYVNGNENCIHATMPSFYKCGLNEDYADLDKLISLLSNSSSSYSLEIQPFHSKKDSVVIEGKTFGGCFTVLTGLIGTRFFPKNLDGHILFFEDITESLNRLVRGFQQWLQSGVLQGVKAFVFGSFSDCGENARSHFCQRVYSYTGIPCYISDNFGHISSNYPLLIGKKASISENQITWSL